MIKEPKFIQVPFGKIQPWGKNPRNIRTESLKKLAKSIQEKGQFQVLTCWENGDIYETGGGNMRWQAMKNILKYPDDKTIWISLNFPENEKEKIELSLLDNMRFGEYEEEKLAELVYPYIDEIELGDYKIDVGEPVNLQDVIEDYAPNLDGSEDEVPEIDDSPAITKTGDLFKLGRHRLLCGDATKEEDVKRLMGREKADFVITDPPYQVGKSRIQNDDLETEDFNKFNARWLKLTWNIMRGNTAFISFHWPRSFVSLLDEAREIGFQFCRYLTEYKPNDRTYPWYGWLMVSESILLFQKGDKAPWQQTIEGTENTKSHDVYVHKHTTDSLVETGGEGLHPSVKPLWIIKDLILKSSMESSLGYEPFLGSGTTLIACEKLNRICYGIEIDSKYCDVIIKRYADYTGTPEEKIRETVEHG